jgi:prepilin-type N-terminal cleavage/methylation domain-containing protein
MAERRILLGTHGFTLTELIVVMAIFMSVLIISATAFNTVLTNSGQQMKSAETQIEGIVGLELFRSDIQHAGFGLPWAFLTPIIYDEGSVSTSAGVDITGLRDDNNVPHAVLSVNNAGLNGSDYLVIKSTVSSLATTAKKWTYLHYSTVGTVNNSTAKVWSSPADLSDGERVIVVRSSFTNGVINKQLVSKSNVEFFTSADKDSSSGKISVPLEFSPPSATDTYLVYGIAPTDANYNPRMPFNRTDYYVKRPATMPGGCAPNTGVLYKAIMSHSNGVFTEIPLVDCIAGMQIVYSMDSLGTGVIDSHRDASFGTPGAQGPLPSAAELRQQLREIRVYILAQDGKKDMGFTYPDQTITLGEFGMGADIDLSSVIGADWSHYRWKIYTIVVQPKSLN